MFPTTITQKGQVTIPKKLREKYKINNYDTVVVESGEGYIKITPRKDILDLAGTFRPKNKKSVLAAREELEKNYRRV